MDAVPWVGVVEYAGEIPPLISEAYGLKKEPYDEFLARSRFCRLVDAGVPEPSAAYLACESVAKGLDISALYSSFEGHVTDGKKPFAAALIAVNDVFAQKGIDDIVG